jgi:heptosyltransferase-2
LTKILIIAPSWVGDTVMAQPLFMRLKEQDPGATLDVFAPAWVAPLLRRMPQVHEVITNPFAHGELRLGVRWKLGRAFASQHYHQAIVLPNSLKSALIPFLAGIPKRTGFVGEFRYGLLNDARKLDEKSYPLMVERFALLAEPPGRALSHRIANPRLATDEDQRDTTLSRLELSLDRPVAVFCPGAEYGPAKRWPAAHFAELGKLLVQQGYQVWLLGSAKDQVIGDQIRQASGNLCTNLCGKTTLDQAVDVLSCASLVVTNDSGLMHVAAALDRPMVALYGSSSPGFTPPLSPHARILSLNLSCSPCFQRECPLGHLDCLIKLTPEQVMKVLEPIRLSGNTPSHPA